MTEFKKGDRVSYLIFGDKAESVIREIKTISDCDIELPVPLAVLSNGITIPVTRLSHETQKPS